MTTQAVTYSSNQKLWSTMTRNDAKAGGEKIMIEFVKADKNQDDILAADEIQGYNSERKKSTIKKVLIGAGIAVAVGVVGFLAYKGFKLNKNLTKQLTNAQNVLKQTDDVLKQTQKELLHTKHHTLLESIPKKYKSSVLEILEEAQTASTKLQKEKPLTGICSGYSAGAINFRKELQGGLNAEVKGKILKAMEIERIHLINDYNGCDPLIGYRFNGKDFSLANVGDQLSFSSRLDAIFDQVTKGYSSGELNISPDRIYYR